MDLPEESTGECLQGRSALFFLYLEAGGWGGVLLPFLAVVVKAIVLGRKLAFARHRFYPVDEPVICLPVVEMELVALKLWCSLLFSCVV